MVGQRTENAANVPLSCNRAEWENLESLAEMERWVPETSSVPGANMGMLALQPLWNERSFHLKEFSRPASRKSKSCPWRKNAPLHTQYRAQGSCKHLNFSLRDLHLSLRSQGQDG